MRFWLGLDQKRSCFINWNAREIDILSDENPFAVILSEWGFVEKETLKTRKRESNIQIITLDKVGLELTGENAYHYYQ